MMKSFVGFITTFHIKVACSRNIVIILHPTALRYMHVCIYMHMYIFIYVHVHTHTYIYIRSIIRDNEAYECFRELDYL